MRLSRLHLKRETAKKGGKKLARRKSVASRAHPRSINPTSRRASGKKHKSDRVYSPRIFSPSLCVVLYPSRGTDKEERRLRSHQYAPAHELSMFAFFSRKSALSARARGGECDSSSSNCAGKDVKV